MALIIKPLDVTALIALGMSRVIKLIEVSYRLYHLFK